MEHEVAPDGMAGEVEQMDTPTSFFSYVREASILHDQLDWLVHGMEYFVAAVDILGCVILLIGATRFLIGFVRAELSGDARKRVEGVNMERVELGRYILAGLELLIVSDIVHTALSLAMADLVFLGLLVVIRSLISFFLERELERVKKELAT
ncbi:DUF1622 domain-containing protein [Jannaschia marina]|uniref:DUF1622 domain-containing protein n=1 Tax=Jannaschia marina TaxID=2741674 RepID=UPI001F45AE9C|nr:DUF1622 domain-containing protein [Jannaschia marina]